MPDFRKCEACNETIPNDPRSLYAHGKVCAQRGQLIPGRTCPACGGPARWAASRYGMFKGCERYGKGCDGKVGASRKPTYVSAPDHTPTDAPTHTPAPQETPAVTTTPAPTTTPPSALDVLDSLGALGASIRAAIEESAARTAREVAATVHQTPGQVIHTWHTPDGQPVAKVPAEAHASAATVVSLIAAGFRTIMLVGPAGTGKTTLVRDVARALDRACYMLSCNVGTGPEAFTGIQPPSITDRPAPFVHGFLTRTLDHDGPKVIGLDEIDSLDAGAACALNEFLANQRIMGADGTERSCNAQDIIIATANTYGTGPDRQYVGRNQLDAATLDRFAGAIVEVDYDRALEGRLAPAEVCAAVWTLRERVGALKLRRIISTRGLLAAARHHASGKTLAESLKTLQTGWTSDEVSRTAVA